MDTFFLLCHEREITGYYARLPVFLFSFLFLFVFVHFDLQNGAYTKCRFFVFFHCGACRRESAHQPDDCNGYGYLLVRVFCTCLGFQANVVEEYGLLTAFQHIFAGLKRTRDQRLASGLKSGQWNLSVTVSFVEEHGLLSALQHIFVGLKRTRDQQLSSGLSYPSLQVEDKRACWLRFGFQHDSYLQ